MEYILQTNALKKEYGKYKALDGLTMHVPKGSIYGLVGKNGAGKTTLIRVICGLQKPTGGTYTLYGKENTGKEIKKARQQVGAVVEAPAIYLEMTAEENIKQQYRILGLPSFDGVAELLKLVGLENTGKKKAKTFSLGMRQRIGIAIALAGNPDFLILDEPVNGLDPQGIIEIRELILKLNRERQVTILVSSHILDELARIATHYGFVEQGHIVKEMSAEELEAACRKRIYVEVGSTKALAHVLTEWNMDYAILSDRAAYIYGKVNISKLVFALADEKCELFTVKEQEESLESYYVSLVGGADFE